jgi:hypothetical protein
VISSTECAILTALRCFYGSAGPRHVHVWIHRITTLQRCSQGRKQTDCKREASEKKLQQDANNA